MITDRETNVIYLSELLKERHPRLFNTLVGHFDKSRICHGLLPKTSDNWAVDYMPVQVDEEKFVQFTYDPDYLKGQKWNYLKTDPTRVCALIGVDATESSLVIDGGNVIRCRNKVIMTSKVFNENPDVQHSALVKQLEELLEVDSVIIIPQEPRDFIGHADGMVRFINENTVVVNQYPQNNRTYKDFTTNLKLSLKNAGLEVYELLYTSWRNNSSEDASGCYINFLEIGDCIFLPLFRQHEDIEAFNMMKNLFPDREIIAIDCNELAKEGGVLNCITWNIYKRDMK